MTHRPFDPDELGQPSPDAERAIAELESYLADTATGAPHGLAQRVIAAVEHEPAPRRGFLGWLLAPSGATSRVGRLARASVLAATLVIAVGGAIFAGELTGLIRNVGNGSPSEVESVSPSPSSSELPSPTISEEPSSSESPGSSEDAHPSPRASGVPDGSESEIPDATDDGGGAASRTPRPTRTASPTPDGSSHP
jgi:hypothetical protein